MATENQILYSPDPASKDKCFLTIKSQQAHLLQSRFRSIIQASPTSLVPGPLGWAWGSDVPPTVSKERVWDYLMKLNRQKSPGPDEMHPKVLGELDDVAMPLSITFEKLWELGEVPGDWKKGKYSCF